MTPKSLRKPANSNHATGAWDVAMLVQKTGFTHAGVPVAKRRPIAIKRAFRNMSDRQLQGSKSNAQWL